MKNKLLMFLFSFVIVLSSVMISSSADAYYVVYRSGYHDAYYGGYHDGYDGYYGRGYYHRYHECTWVGGFWRHGYWHPAQKVCWYR